MADTARRVEYYYVTVPDTVGEGDRILAALRDSGVNLLAYLGFPLGGGQSQLDLVPEEPESLKEAAARAGITLSEAKWRFSFKATTAWARLPRRRGSWRRRT